MRLYKVIGTQPFPLLCLAETGGGPVVAGVCVLEEAKQRSLSEQLSTDGTLDPKTFTI